MPQHLTKDEILKLLALLQRHRGWFNRLESRLEARQYGNADQLYEATRNAASAVHHLSQVVRGLDADGSITLMMGSRKNRFSGP